MKVLLIRVRHMKYKQYLFKIHRCCIMLTIKHDAAIVKSKGCVYLFTQPSFIIVVNQKY